MNLIKPLSPLLMLFTLSVTAFAQDSEKDKVRQEITLSPSYVFRGQMDVPSTEPYYEQGSGYGISLGYSVLFGWIGVTMNYYAQFCDAGEEAILERYDYLTVTTGDYNSHGFLAGVDLNFPVTKEDFKTYVHLGFTAGAFIANLPEQEFVLQNEQNYKYNTSSNPGFVNQAVIGAKADLNDMFAVSVDFAGLFENAVISRTSYGSLTGTQYYKWNFNYTAVKLNLIYHF